MDIRNSVVVRLAQPAREVEESPSVGVLRKRLDVALRDAV